MNDLYAQQLETQLRFAEEECQAREMYAYERGKADGRAETKADIAKECKYLLDCGMGKKKAIKHLIKILEKEQTNEQNIR